MKEKNLRNPKLMLVLIFVLMLSISVSSSINPQMSAAKERNPELKSYKVLYDRLPNHLHKTDVSALLSQYIAHDPIVIDDNGDFSTLGFPGEGSPEDPYVIDGLNLTHAAHSSHIISIKSTTVYFHIRNNLINGLAGYYNGIVLINVIHGTIDNNIITNCGDGIVLSQNSMNNAISHNLVVNNSRKGIGLWDSRNNTILGNHLVNNDLSISGKRVEDYVQAHVADNMINGKILVYWQNLRQKTVPQGAGQIILVNSTAIEVAGQELLHVSIGLLAVSSSNLNIHHNFFCNNSQVGISLHGSNNTVVNNTIIGASRKGIVFGGSGNVLRHNNVSRCGKGLSIADSNNTLSNNHISQCKTGIDLAGSNNTLIHSDISQCETGLYIFGAPNNTVAHNTFSNCKKGIEIIRWYFDIDVYIYSKTEPNHNIFVNNTIFICSTGIYFGSETGHTFIISNNISSCGNGIALWGSVSNSIIDNIISNNTAAGIVLSGSNNNLAYNTISLCKRGFYLWSAMNNSLVSNIIANNSLYGILLRESGNNNMLDNHLYSNGLLISGYKVENYFQGKVANNKVNERPLIYWQNVIGKTVPLGAGQVVLVNTNNVEVMDQDLSLASAGLIAAFSTNLKIHHNRISNNSYSGISLQNSTHNALTNNILADNQLYGIILASSGNNTLFGNDLINNGLFISSRQAVEFNPTYICESYSIHLKDYIQTLVEDNLVNGRPLIYWQNVVGGAIPPNSGQIVLINTTGVDVTGQDLSWTSVGLLAAFNTNLDIYHNNLSNNTEGIVLVESKNINISHNNITEFRGGISLVRVEFCTISINTIVTGEIGIYFATSDNCTITQNTVSNCVLSGITLQDAAQISLSCNNISRCDTGILLCSSGHNTLSHNNVTACRTGIDISNIGHNTLSHNRIITCETGIELSNTGRNSLVFNSVADNTQGMIFEWGAFNTLSNNVIANNTSYGIIFKFPSWTPLDNNTVKWNNFLGNNPGGNSQAIDDGRYNIFVENYWDNHNNTDQNNDGIADTPYPIDGRARNFDESPLTTFKNETSPFRIPGFDLLSVLVVLPLRLWFQKRHLRNKNNKRKK